MREGFQAHFVGKLLRKSENITARHRDQVAPTESQVIRDGFDLEIGIDDGSPTTADRKRRLPLEQFRPLAYYVHSHG
jgi:hypothetical protein